MLSNYRLHYSSIIHHCDITVNNILLNTCLLISENYSTFHVILFSSNTSLVSASPWRFVYPRCQRSA